MNVAVEERYEAKESGAKEEVIEDFFTPRWLSIQKRAIDIIASVITLTVFSPVMLVIAILIRLDSPGPAIFKQVRVGQNRRFRRGKKKGNDDRRRRNLNGTPFRFYKFRTMYGDARERWPELYKYDYTPEEIATMRFKLIDDPRLTRVGEWLRRTTLDELPNFFNVLIGNMTLIGPRPDIPEMMQYYTKEQRFKFAVKPGLTGLAQCEGRGLLTFQETLAKDVYYVKHQSIRIDMKILCNTLWHLITRRGAF